jgi:hypothetical protein
VLGLGIPEAHAVDDEKAVGDRLGEGRGKGDNTLLWTVLMLSVDGLRQCTVRGGNIRVSPSRTWSSSTPPPLPLLEESNECHSELVPPPGKGGRRAVESLLGTTLVPRSWRTVRGAILGDDLADPLQSTALAFRFILVLEPIDPEPKLRREPQGEAELYNVKEDRGWIPLEETAVD